MDPYLAETLITTDCVHLSDIPVYILMPIEAKIQYFYTQTMVSATLNNTSPLVQEWHHLIQRGGQQTDTSAIQILR